MSSQLTAGAPTATPTTFLSMPAFTMDTAAPRECPHSVMLLVLMPFSWRYPMHFRASMISAACHGQHRSSIMEVSPGAACVCIAHTHILEPDANCSHACVTQQTVHDLW